ncbi:MAG: hypothetical protein ABWY77_06130 [Acidimicrobiia bacterium]
MSATGTWNITMNTPMGAQAATLILVEEGSSLTGTMSAAAMGEEEISEGTVDGDALAWKFAMTSPMPMTLEFDAAVAGDSITGNVKLGSFGNATFEGTRG